MSGHSKWSSIKHQKGVADARRGKLFTKYTQEIIVAVREGGASPEGNSRLRLAIQKAKDSSMPNDNIERAIKRGSGTLDGGEVSEVVLEGYGPGGVAVLVNALTDNHNRTVQEVRHAFSRAGGSLAAKGSVAWNFEPKGVITIPGEDVNADKATLMAIDAGAEDVSQENGVIEVYTVPEDMEEVREKLEAGGIEVSSSELSMVPKSTVNLDTSAALQTLKLLEKLEELDDVQRVASNADFPPEALEQFQES